MVTPKGLYFMIVVPKLLAAGLEALVGRSLR